MLTGCASTAENEFEQSARSLYQEAKASLDAGDYETAIQRLETLEARFPFGRFAQQAQLDMAYAYFKYNEAESAVATAERFIKLYPRHPNVDYAFYLKGLIMFTKGQGAFDFLDSQDPAKRDPESAKNAFRYFAELVERYPNSKYTRDAIERMRYLRNSLSRHEIYAARFYLKRKAWLAAATRAKYVIETFPNTPAVPEALSIMTRAYTKLGLNDLAADSLRVFKASYPEHKLLKKLYKSTDNSTKG